MIIVIAVLASIAVPKFSTAWRSGSESRLRANLKEYRNAIERFHTDTGLYPATMSDIRRQSSPATGLDTNGISKSIPAGSWQGPYMVFYSWSSNLYPDLRALQYTYVLSPPTVGKLYFNSSRPDLNGTAYNRW